MMLGKQDEKALLSVCLVLAMIIAIVLLCNLCCLQCPEKPYKLNNKKQSVHISIGEGNPQAYINESEKLLEMESVALLQTRANILSTVISNQGACGKNDSLQVAHIKVA